MKASSFYLFSSMCGIAGYFTVNPSPSPPTLLDRMTQAIQHRGPDAHGVFHDDDLVYPSAMLTAQLIC